MGPSTSMDGKNMTKEKDPTFIGYSGSRYVRGCVQSCSDVDGCNGSVVKSLSIDLYGLILTMLMQ